MNKQNKKQHRRDRRLEPKTSKPFRFSAKVKAVLGLAQAITNASTSDIVDACCRKSVLKSAPESVLKKVKIEAESNRAQLESVLKQEFPIKRANPSNCTISKAVLRHVGVAAESGGFAEGEIVETCIEREVAGVVYDLTIANAPLGSQSTAVAFSTWLLGIGVKKSPQAVGLRKTKRLLKSSQASADLVDPKSTPTHRIIDIPGIGPVSTAEIAKLATSGSRTSKNH